MTIRDALASLIRAIADESNIDPDCVSKAAIVAAWDAYRPAENDGRAARYTVKADLWDCGPAAEPSPYPDPRGEEEATIVGLRSCVEQARVWALEACGEAPDDAFGEEAMRKKLASARVALSKHGYAVARFRFAANDRAMLLRLTIRRAEKAQKAQK